MNRKSLLAAAFAALLLFGFTVPPAIAYFTCYTEAEGVQIVKFSDDTTIEEPVVKDWVKHLVVKNTGDTPVFVRATAFAGSDYTLKFSGNNWDIPDTPPEDGYYYYELPVDTGESAEELLVQILGVPEEEALELGDSFNVAVVYEAVPVRYKADGSLEAYDDPDVWSQELIIEDE